MLKIGFLGLGKLGLPVALAIESKGHEVSTVQSGNDACIVVAEGLAGSEELFAEKMNAKAKALGLTQSNFKNSTIESISSTWLEIFNDDQHIKSLDIEIGNFDKNIVDDEHEKRLLSILEQKDNELKKITEKYGQ